MFPNSSSSQLFEPPLVVQETVYHLMNLTLSSLEIIQMWLVKEIKNKVIYITTFKIF